MRIYTIKAKTENLQTFLGVELPRNNWHIIGSIYAKNKNDALQKLYNIIREKSENVDNILRIRKEIRILQKNEEIPIGFIYYKIGKPL